MKVFQNTGTHPRVFLVSQLQSRRKSGIGQAQYSYSLPEGWKLQHLLDNQINKGSLQETQCYSRASSGRIGDLITAYHIILSEGCNFRNNHRYPFVVQDLATQWIQSYPCKTKPSQETEKSLRKFLELTMKPKVICTDNSLEFGKIVKNCPETIVRQHFSVQKQMGLLRERYAGSGKGPLPYSCNQVWMKNGGRIP